MNLNLPFPTINQTWQKRSALPAGGTVSGISSASGLWLCSPAGIFYAASAGGPFKHQMGGIPFSSASAVLAVGKTVLAAGYPNLIVRSANRGRTWFTCWADEIAAPVTCFAASASFSRDATILAGSDGDGILRSTDGGNTWRLSNFGLRSFNILDLAWAPAWEPGAGPNAVAYKYEIVFAATEAGVYQSPNAGRAWRFAGEGLPAAAVLAVAVSPDFKKTPVLADTAPDARRGAYRGAVFAGTDGAGLYRSLDGGESWQAVVTLPSGGEAGAQATINTLYFDPAGTLFVGTGEGGILASPDLGESWQSRLQIADTVLRLAGQGMQLFAGSGEQGLWVSDDQGRTWQMAQGLSARRLTQLAGLALSQPAAHPRAAGMETQSAGSLQSGVFLAAGGLSEGLWELSGAAAWRRADKLGSVDWPDDQPVMALQAAPPRLLALTPNYLLSAQQPGQAWEPLAESPIPFTALACAGEEICLGSLNGEIWYSNDGGERWHKPPVPWRKARLLALHIAPGGAHGSLVYAVTRTDSDGMLALWRADSSTLQWALRLQERVNWQAATLARLHPAAGAPSDQDILLASGTELFTPEGRGWRRRTVTTPDAPVLALFALDAPDCVLLAKADGLLLSRDRGTTWQPAGLAEQAITALASLPGEPGAVLALTSDGAIFAGRF